MIAAFAPLWIITILGWAASRFGMFSASVEKGLTHFAFSVAIPAVVFTTLVKLPLAKLPLVPLAAYAVSAVVVGLLGYLMMRRAKFDERVIAGMASAYVNSGNLGIPVAIYVLGDASLIVAVVAFQTVLATPVIAGMLDKSGKRLWTLPLRVPVVLASAAGVLFTVSGLTLPGMALRPLEILGGAAVPVALFALGMSLHLPPGERPSLTRPELGLTVLAKIVIHPLVAYLVARFLFGLDGAALIAVTLFAGLPTAQNTYIYATQYNVPNGLSRDAVLVTSVLSLASLSLILWLLS
ncbi:MAG TPA: AEC family transporter [Micromonosporaceae bacterium]|nr:AEC family transporter [Micromonosporaceae bacterium]HCU50521.1 AEC family transporter [Micromonosporaceae bacterium]